MKYSNMTYSIEQEEAFQKYSDRKNIFITGPGGTGKSALIKRIYKDALDRMKRIQVCALTGCAAVLLNCKAKTIHSWAGIGIADDTIENIAYKVSKSFFKKKNWKSVDILIIDEVSMMSKKLFEVLDCVGRTVRKCNKPFGGIQLIFSGDFYQIPPVGNKNDPDSACFCFESELWNETFLPEDHIQLVTNSRQEDKLFTKVLSEIREGTLQDSSITLLRDYVRTPKIDSLNDIKPTKLFPTRHKVDKTNKMEIDKLDSEVVTYVQKFLYELPITSTERKIKEKATKESIEMELQSIQNSLLCEKEIQLKIGCQVMCVINSDALGAQLYNGSQGKVVGFTQSKYPIVKFNHLSGEFPIIPHVWTSDNIPGIGVSQIPLVLAWAISIHKSQGASLDMAEMDVGSGIFEYGQTYVALSRVRSLEGLYLTSFDEKKVKVNPKVKEFYEHLLAEKLCDGVGDIKMCV